MAQTVTFAELHRSFAAYFDELEQNRRHLVVTRQADADMAILPLAELEAMLETIHLLGTPANAGRLTDATAQLDAERGIERDIIDK